MVSRGEIHWRGCARDGAIEPPGHGDARVMMAMGKVRSAHVNDGVEYERRNGARRWIVVRPFPDGRGQAGVSPRSLIVKGMSTV